MMVEPTSVDRSVVDALIEVSSLVGPVNDIWRQQNDKLELKETEEEIEAYLTRLMDNTDQEGVGTSNNGTTLMMADMENDGDMEMEDCCVIENMEMDDNNHL